MTTTSDPKRATCSHADCDAPVRSLGLCRKHYRQQRLAKKRGVIPATPRPARDRSGPKRGSVLTKLETDAEGKVLRVYHRAGTVTVEGAKFPHERFAWTHPADDDTREACDACKLGLIPSDVLDDTYKEATR